jgi:putative flippase GtrA
MADIAHTPGFKQKSFGFIVVGATGFCIDAFILHWLIHAGISPYAARLASIACAMTVTWLLNRNFSFGKSKQHLANEYLSYAFVAFTAAALNYSVYASLVGNLTPFAAMVAGSAVAMTISFVGYDRLVFVKK